MIFSMKVKDVVFNRIQEIKAQVENLTRKKIKALRTEIGGEYTSKDFNDFPQGCQDQEGFGSSLQTSTISSLIKR